MTGGQAGSRIMQVVDAGLRYGQGWALRHCSLELRPGTITALVGPNGAGKSTLMLATAGLIELTEGRISVNGTDVVAGSVHADLGFLAQDKPLYRQFTVRDMLEVGRHLNLRWDAHLAARLCREAGLERRAKVRTLSGGQRARLALVLARRPRLLLLDEPLANLDPLARLEVQQTLLAEVAETGMTVLVSSHILGEVQDACDDLMLLVDGRITLHGSIEDTLEGHLLLTGPGGDDRGLASLSDGARVVQVRRSARQLSVLLDGRPSAIPEGWTLAAPTIEEIVVARLRSAAQVGEAAA